MRRRCAPKEVAGPLDIHGDMLQYVPSRWHKPSPRPPVEQIPLQSSSFLVTPFQRGVDFPRLELANNVTKQIKRGYGSQKSSCLAFEDFYEVFNACFYRTPGCLAFGIFGNIRATGVGNIRSLPKVGVVNDLV
mmetsp:Transcript_21871/g.70451  ORF Transcript_21871/g.70451 Transcript_21871/m.70451 type:complete len:133 (-) Transcript_21871:5166-5564(-)